MPDFIPVSEGKLDDFANTFGGFVADSAPASLSPAIVANVATALAAWKTAYATHKTAQTAATVAASRKDTAKVALIAAIRPAAGIIQSDPAVTGAQRQKAGLRVPDTIRTRASVPAARPIAQVDISMRLQHTLSWRDEATPTRRAKPKGVLGAEIWSCIGPNPPTSPGQCHFVAMATSGRYVLPHDAADAGKSAHYLLRWVNTRSEHGPWSETLSATIGA